MASKRLQGNDTFLEVPLCDWHLRKIFWDRRLWARAKSGELGILPGPVRPRINPTVSSPAPYNQQIVIFDPSSNEEIARCHQFLEADMKTLGASGKPDPKQIRIDGFEYHQLGKKNTVCAHCAAGITTYPEDPNAAD